MSINATDPTIVNAGGSFCKASELADVSHTLLVNVKGSSSEIFWFDYLHYLSSASASLADAAIEIYAADPMWDFGTAWTSYLPGLEYGTNQMGAKLNFEFHGALCFNEGYPNSLVHKMIL